MAFVPNIVPLFLITNMMNSQRSSSIKPTYSKGPSHVDNSCLPSEVYHQCHGGDCRSKGNFHYGDPESDLIELDSDELDIWDMPEFTGFNDLPDFEEPVIKETNEKDKPYNLLFEVYRLGLTHGFGCLGGHSENIQKIIEEMNKLSKKFGYSGYEAFDRVFDDNENIIK